MQAQLNFTQMSYLVFNVYLHGISAFSPVFVCVSAHVYMYEGDTPN